MIGSAGCTALSDMQHLTSSYGNRPSGTTRLERRWVIPWGVGQNTSRDNGPSYVAWLAERVVGPECQILSQDPLRDRRVSRYEYFRVCSKVEP